MEIDGPSAQVDERIPDELPRTVKGRIPTTPDAPNRDRSPASRQVLDRAAATRRVDRIMFEEQEAVARPRMRCHDLLLQSQRLVEAEKISVEE